MPKRRSPRPPKQARSKVLVDAVIEAAARVVRDVGWSQANMSRIAKVAGVSVGSLYRYFPGRDLLLTALIDYHLTREAPAFEEALSAMQGPRPQDSVRAFVHSLTQDTRITDPMLLRQLVDVLETAGRIDKVRAVFDDHCKQFCARMLELHPHLDSVQLHRRAHMSFWGLRGAFIAQLRVQESFDLNTFTQEALWLLEQMLVTEESSLEKNPNQAEYRQHTENQVNAQVATEQD